MSIMKCLDEVGSRALLILGPDELGSILPALKADRFFKDQEFKSAILAANAAEFISEMPEKGKDISWASWIKFI